MRLCSIASGSSGNCIYVGTDTTHVLVDAGISKKRVEEGLHTLELTGQDIDGVLVTHEHSDHIAGLGVFCRRYGTPIYATPGTIAAIRRSGGIGELPEDLFFPVEPDEAFSIKDLSVNPMSVSHDAAQPAAFRFSCGGRRAAVCTDLGVFNEYTVECLKGMDVLLLEANHDVHMLQVGGYPYYLKQRILGDRGHLSNENAGRLLASVLHDGLQSVILGHLSKENNLPQLADATVRLEIDMADNPYKSGDFPIQIASRSSVSAPVFF